MSYCEHAILIIIFSCGVATRPSLKSNQPKTGSVRRNYEHSSIYLIVTQIDLPQLLSPKVSDGEFYF